MRCRSPSPARWLTGGTLIGLITRHGILIVEFANQLREQGRSKAAEERNTALLAQYRTRFSGALDLYSL